MQSVSNSPSAPIGAGACEVLAGIRVREEGLEMNFDSRAFRNALGNFPTGVVIVTAQAEDGQPLGITVSSFNAVSLDPPLILFSVAKSNRGYAEWCKVEDFAINVLHDGQHALSNKFGRSTSDKWDGIDHTVGKSHVRIVPEAIAWFECSCFARHDGGDHIIIVGLVKSIHESEDKKNPLIFFRGAYHSLVDKHPTWPATDLYGTPEWHF